MTTTYHVSDLNTNLFRLPQFIFFLNEAPTFDTDSAKCTYTLWDIARYNSKLMSKNVELIHINDQISMAKYNYNRCPEPYKTYVKLTQEDDYENPELQYMYVLDSDYHAERFNHERNQLVRILGKLNAKSVYFRESSDTTCSITCTSVSQASSSETEMKKEKMDDLMQRNLFDDKQWTEAEIRAQFRDLDVYPKKMQELINKRFSGVVFDGFSSTFTDYTDISSQLTDVFNMYFGCNCSRQVSKKITYMYTIKYYSYKKSHVDLTGSSCPDKSSSCLCMKMANTHVVENAHGNITSPEDLDPFNGVSDRKFLDTTYKQSKV